MDASLKANPHGFSDRLRLFDGLLGQRLLRAEDEEREDDQEKEGTHRKGNEVRDLSNVQRNRAKTDLSTGKSLIRGRSVFRSLK